VARGFVLRGGSVAKLPKVSRSGAREGLIRGGVWLATLVARGGVLNIRIFGTSVSWL
jgi:hypothetical protein